MKKKNKHKVGFGQQLRSASGAVINIGNNVYLPAACDLLIIEFYQSADRGILFDRVMTRLVMQLLVSRIELRASENVLN